MAIDLYPYSQRNGGAVSDLEHEGLWAGWADGVLPGQSSQALSVSIAGDSWMVQPGRFLISGHVLVLDQPVTGAVPGGSTATATHLVVAYIDRTQTPWAYGVKLALGTAGAGRPNIPKSPTGRYEVALRAFTVAPSPQNTVTLLADERPFLSKTGGGLLAQASEWQSTNVVDVTRSDGTPIIRSNYLGRVGIGRDPGSSTHLIVQSVSDDITFMVQKRSGQTEHLTRWADANSSTLAWVDASGNIHAPNVDGTTWTSFAPTWNNTGTSSYSIRTMRWRRVGPRHVDFKLWLRMPGTGGGSGTNNVTFTLPTTPARAVPQTFSGVALNPVANVQATVTPDGAGNTVDSLIINNASVTHALWGQDLTVNREIIISGSYEEA